MTLPVGRKFPEIVQATLSGRANCRPPLLGPVTNTEISKPHELRLAARVTHAKVALLVAKTGGVLKAFSYRTAGGGRMSKRILVVEDQPDNRQIIRDMLAPTD